MAPYHTMMRRSFNFPGICASLALLLWLGTVIGSALFTMVGSPPDGSADRSVSSGAAPGLSAPTELDDPSSGVATRVVAPRPFGPKRLGFAINIHNVYRREPYLRAIDDIAALGADSVQILTPMYQDDGSSSAIRHDAARSTDPDDLVAILEYAHEQGLRTTLMPIVLFSSPRGNEWRGKIIPEDWAAWWASYETNLLRCVDLAVAAGADVFVVGSELNSTEAMTRRWARIISLVRDRFQGELTYSANWDRYRKVPMWDLLDLISISAWYEISDDPDASAEQLAASWASIRKDILAFARSRNRPVAFSEIGYPTVPWALQDPWNYVADPDTVPDPEQQQRGLDAFFKAWIDSFATDPYFVGFHCYEWDVHRAGGPYDFGYGIRGKPAHPLVRDWFGRYALRRQN